MIDPAPLAHEPSDAEIARRIAVLDLPTDDPQRRWEPFVRHLDPPITLTAALLSRWLGGRSVGVTDLLTRCEGDRQYRVVSLVTEVDGELLPLCHAGAVVRLQPLPGWARTALTRTEQSLAGTLHRVGAVRDRGRATVLEADPDAPGDAGLRVDGAFRLPAAGGRLVAEVEEWFTGYVLELGPEIDADFDADFDIDGGAGGRAARTTGPTAVDATLVTLRQRRAAATDPRPADPCPAGSQPIGPPPVGPDPLRPGPFAPGSDQRLARRLVRLLGREGRRCPEPERDDGPTATGPAARIGRGAREC